MYDKKDHLDHISPEGRAQKNEEIKGEATESYSSLNELKLRLKVYIISRYPPHVDDPQHKKEKRRDRKGRAKGQLNGIKSTFSFRLTLMMNNNLKMKILMKFVLSTL